MCTSFLKSWQQNLLDFTITMFCSGDSEKQKNKFLRLHPTPPIFQSTGVKLKMKRMSGIVYTPLECSLRTILHVTVLLISKKYGLFISIQHLAKPAEQEVAEGKITLINPRFWDIMVCHWVSGYWHFETMAFQNPTCCIPSDAVLYPTRMDSSNTLLWKSENWQEHLRIYTAGKCIRS